jgi:hypothetical protein
MKEHGWSPVRGSAPAAQHVDDPARRQIGESYKDYANRIYGMYRASLVGLERQRQTVLALHFKSNGWNHPTGGIRRDHTHCVGCNQEWPCPTAAVLGVPG